MSGKSETFKETTETNTLGLPPLTAQHQDVFDNLQVADRGMIADLKI